MRIKMDSLGDLAKLLDVLPARVESNVMRKVVRAGSTPIWQRFIANIGQLGKGTGNLRRGCGRLVRKMRRGGYAGVVGYWYRAAPHAHLIEAGTVERVQTKTGRYTGRMPAFAPLRRAWDATFGAAESAMRSKLTAEVDAEVSKLARGGYAKAKGR